MVLEYEDLSLLIEIKCIETNTFSRYSHWYSKLTIYCKTNWKTQK
jgi:hypothetical protein